MPVNEIVESYGAARAFMQAHRPRAGDKVVLAYVGSFYDQPDLGSRFPGHATYAEKRSLFIVDDEPSIAALLDYMAAHAGTADVALAGGQPAIHQALLARMGGRTLPPGVLAPMTFDLDDLGPAARLASARFAGGGLQPYHAGDLAAAEFLLRWIPGDAVLHAPVPAATLEASRIRLLARGAHDHLLRVGTPLRFA
jgi:hypothetical protein